jgi:hypothetical protein
MPSDPASDTHPRVRALALTATIAIAVGALLLLFNAPCSAAGSAALFPARRAWRAVCSLVRVRWTNRRALFQVSHAVPTIAPSPTRANAVISPTDKLKLLPGNDRCADCGRAAPDWSASNHGVLICIRCAGVHRKMGTHISTVLSLTADDWDVEILALVHDRRGNLAVNRALEAKLPAYFDHADLLQEDYPIERFIRSKYESGRFRRESTGQLVDQPIVAISSSKVAMIEYVGIVFIELLAGAR